MFGGGNPSISDVGNVRRGKRQTERVWPPGSEVKNVLKDAGDGVCCMMLAVTED